MINLVEQFIHFSVLNNLPKQHTKLNYLDNLYEIITTRIAVKHH